MGIFKVKKNLPTKRVTGMGDVVTILPQNDYCVVMGNTVVLDIKDYLQDTQGMARLACDALNAYDKVHSHDTLSFRLKGDKNE